MTSDEVVAVLNNLLLQMKMPENKQGLTSAISFIQDYQKLREKLTLEKIDTEISIVFADYALNGQGSRNLTNDLSQAIITYLQQPTEPIAR